MSSFRRPLILVLTATAVVYAACSSGTLGGTTAAGACSDGCNKQESCGDIDSVTADQCRTKCSADAQQLDALAASCLNESDILDATEQCLARACTDYVACLTTLPACLTSGGTTTSGGTGGTGTGGSTGTGGGGTTTHTMPTGLSCTETSGGFTACYVFSSGSSVTQCPPNSNQVSSCPTTDELGYCTISDGGSSDSVYFYSTGSLTASQAQSACSAQGGTWTPA